MKHFATFKLNSLLFNHINDFYYGLEENQEMFENHQPNDNRLSKQHKVFKLILEQNDNKLHFALNSRQHEIAYLRYVSKQILQFLLPENVHKCR